MAKENIAQLLADSAGLIIDRTVSPEKVLGQAWLVGRSRVMTCAYTVFNYAEAPWALVVRFPFPDLTLSVKSIALHPDFSKRDARLSYLAQSGAMQDGQPVLEYDIATMVLESQIPELVPDLVGELNGSLSLPFQGAPTDISGDLSGGAVLPNVLQNIVSMRREGVLTLMDRRYVPYARLAVAPDGIQKVLYQGLTNESALFELLYRRPDGMFVFQPPGRFTFPELRNITAPSERLIEEGVRRAGELPNMLSGFGGKDTRYERVMAEFDADLVSPSQRYVTERVFSLLDGYITLDQLWQRVGVDTYAIILGLHELVNTGMAAPSRYNPFHRNGQLGLPRLSQSDFEVRVWDQLTSVYLDPLTCRPIVQQGNFFGIARVLEPKLLLHTIPIAPTGAGAAVLKEGQIIGLHSGPLPAQPGQQLPPVKLAMMMWAGAMNDLGARRLRTQTGEMPAIAQAEIPAAEAQTILARQRLAAGKLGRIPCPSCGVSNSSPGQCFNCGFQIEPPPEVETPHDLIQLPFLPNVQLTKRQALIAAAAAVLFLSLVFLVVPKGAPPPVPAPPLATTTHLTPEQQAEAEKARDVAEKYAGFRGNLPEGFIYVDTSKDTGEQPSFGVNSERSNLKMRFLVYPTQAPVDDLKLITSKLPYSELVVDQYESGDPVAKGQYKILEGPFNWVVKRYRRPSTGQMEAAFIGAYRSPVSGKAIVVIAEVATAGGAFEYQTTSYLVQKMTGESSTTAKTPAEEATQPVSKRKFATQEEINAYYKKLELQLKSTYRPAAEAAKKTIKVQFAINEEGQLSRLEVVESSGKESADKRLVEAVRNSSFSAPPPTRDGQVSVLAVATGTKLVIEAP